MKAMPELERFLLEALRAQDPGEALAGALRGEGPPLSRELRSALAHVDPDGFRIAALLVTKLRFERLLRGSSEAERLFDEDPGGFARLFKRYAHEVSPSAVLPSEEATLFDVWRARTP
ncbi:MAG: hypothetical protein JNK60_15605 [Acidobacteria bacterium]|nr:hypothetical protein [Acidobacteriota bacterium]